MKNLLKLGMALLIAAMLFGITGCFEPEEEDENPGSGVDFANYFPKSDYALGFRNGTPNRLVLFGKNLHKDNVLGGIEGNVSTGESYVSKSKNMKFFETTQAFEVIAVLEDDYKKNKSDPSKIQYPIARVFVFWNADGTNSQIYDIDGRLGGNEYYLQLTMPQGKNTWNAELRDGGITSKAIGYAPYGVFQTRIYVQPNKAFHIFPVFHRWSSITQSLEIAYPTYESGNAYQISFNVTPGDRKFWNVNMEEMLGEIKNRKPNVGAAYVIVDNGYTGSSMIQLSQGDQEVPLKNALGVSMFGPGTRTFEIPMASLSTELNTFAEYAGFNGYKAGVVGQEKAIVPIVDAGESVPSSIQLKNGWVYSVSVTSTSSDPSTISATLNLKTSGAGAPYEFNWEATPQ